MEKYLLCTFYSSFVSPVSLPTSQTALYCSSSNIRSGVYEISPFPFSGAVLLVLNYIYGKEQCMEITCIPARLLLLNEKNHMQLFPLNSGLIF